LVLSLSVQSLHAENLVCIRGGRAVFRDVGFRVSAGETVALEGPNGSGKSSLLRMIAGFLAPVAGTIRIRMKCGEDISDPEERGKLVGWLGHHDAAKPQLTPRETLRFFAKLNGGEANQAEDGIDATLDEVGLGRAHDLPCQYLSAGQKKRLGLARLKMSARPLWLLDEPLAALDADGKKLAADFIKAHCAAGGIALVATHETLGVDSARLVLA
jgi:heme exporter protein A